MSTVRHFFAARLQRLRILFTLIGMLFGHLRDDGIAGVLSQLTVAPQEDRPQRLQRIAMTRTESGKIKTVCIDGVRIPRTRYAALAVGLEPWAAFQVESFVTGRGLRWLADQIATRFADLPDTSPFSWGGGICEQEWDAAIAPPGIPLKNIQRLALVIERDQPVRWEIDAHVDTNSLATTERRDGGVFITRGSENLLVGDTP